jgi:hypothetical protein
MHQKDVMLITFVYIAHTQKIFCKCFPFTRQKEVKGFILLHLNLPQLKGTVRRDVTRVKNKLFVLLNYLTVSLYFLILKRHLHERIKKLCQRLNNNSIEVDWTFSLFLQRMSLYLQFINRACTVQSSYGAGLRRTIILRCRSAPYNHPTIQVCTVQSSYGAGLHFTVICWRRHNFISRISELVAGISYLVACG